MPPPSRRRPTAFEVSFPEEVAGDTQDESASGLDGNNRRRQHDGADHDQDVSVFCGHGRESI
jgi:DNA (cytosine-5)-methyltransferase 1